MAAVWDSLDIDPPTADEWERVMAADDRLLAYEATNILTGGEWADSSPEFQYDLESTPIAPIRERFISRTEMLRNEL